MLNTFITFPREPKLEQLGLFQSCYVTKNTVFFSQEMQETEEVSKSAGISKHQRSFHCDICNKDFMMSAVEILKHKKSHAST